MFKRMAGRFGLVICLFLSSVVAVPAADTPRLVSAEWLAQNLARADIRIVDVRSTVLEYWRGHIPGAVFLNVDSLKMPDHGVPAMLTAPEAMIAILGHAGVTPQTFVAIYSDRSDFKATYLGWALDYIGHKSWGILDGGFEKWAKSGLPATFDYPRIEAVAYHAPGKVNAAVRADLAAVKSVVEKGDAILLDARPADLYSGKDGAWKRKGHIKGAVHHFWLEDLQADGTWKSKADLEQTYKSVGITRDKAVIVSCGQGLMSSHVYYTLKYILDFPNVKNYDGSFNEWSSIEELPVEAAAK
ncbi:MAG: sulfurtransferase [Acidobacteriota bacterium]